MLFLQKHTKLSQSLNIQSQFHYVRSFKASLAQFSIRVNRLGPMCTPPNHRVTMTIESVTSWSLSNFKSFALAPCSSSSHQPSVLPYLYA